MKLSESRWLKSRVMVVGGVVCMMAWVPGIFPAIGGDHQAAWIAGFFVLAPIYLTAIGGNNIAQSWRQGSYTPPQDRPFPEDD